MDFSDAADLLGNDEMPVRQQRWWSFLRVSFYFILSTSVIIAVALAYDYGRSWLRNWREYNHKKSVRRKYGIPDSNNEPFNVAYAKAEQKRREAAQRLAQQQASYQASNRTSAASNVPPERQDEANPPVMRRRVVPSTSDASNAERSEGTSKPRTGLFESRQDGPSSSFVNAPGSFPHTEPSAVPKTNPDVAANDHAAPRSRRKRSLEKEKEEEGESLKKKSRDGDIEEADFVAPNSSMDVIEEESASTSRPKASRGAKRQAGSDEDIANLGSMGKKAGKRARRRSRKVQDVFDAEEADEFMDLEHVTRGKKRDRAEAGSTFGGDDDSPATSHKRKNRRRKRKSNVSAESDSASRTRGTKRTFEVESTLGSDDEGDSIGRSRSSRKRGKRTVNDSYDLSDVSMDDLLLDPSCMGRKIGEEWHANGETYKIGPDGRRLRHVFLRKRKSRYSMPEDSQHPDTQDQFEVFVEKWLNDDDYKAAVERGDVYIPDKGTKESKGSDTVTKIGKQLLWSTTQNGTMSLRPRTVGGSAIADAGVNGNPFERPLQSSYSKRIPIGVDSTLRSPTGSPVMRQSKSYSKWEKQDLEAEAMAKLRKRLEEEKKAASPVPAPILKKVSFQLPTSTAESSGSAPSITSSSSAPASMHVPSTPNKTAEKAAKPTTSNLFTPPQANGDANKVPPLSMMATSSSAPSQIKPPTITLTPPSKETTQSAATKPAFGFPPVSAQTTGVPPDKKETPASESKSNEQASAPSAAPSMPNLFGQKVQGTPNGAASSQPAANLFAKPAAPSNVSASDGTSGAAPVFSFGIKGAAQGEKKTEAPSPFSFGKPAEKPAPSASGASKETAIPNGGSPFGFGVSTGNTGQPAATTATAQGQTASPFSLNTAANKPSEPSNKPATAQPLAGVNAATAPKFNFGFSSKPAASASPAQVQASTSVPKSATSVSPFSFASSVAAQNAAPATNAQSASTPASSSTTAAPKFSFGTPTGQTSSMTATPSAASAGSGSSSGTMTNAPTSSGVPASTGFSFNFGGSKPAGSTSTSSPFGGQPAASSPFSTQSTTSSPFAAQPASSSSFGTQPAGSSPFGTAAKPATASPFGTTGTAFGGAAGTSSTSSPFGTAAKPPGEAPKPLFGAGQSTTSGMTTYSAPTTTEKQENKPAFSFNFGGGAPAAFGGTSASAPNGASSGGVFGSTGASGTSAPAAPTFSFGTGAKPASSPFGASASNMNTNMDTSNNNTSTPNTTNANVFGSSSTGSSVFGAQK
ncbi:uncharacterized protein FOMMEDRAFT_21422 [Fomitiporia mediterranea MF3/22]|uniref:uncharacterized protein n=1 Tax=Fomitiporia mediterranea (strain MF3/22) TaxID=694068 RepID=UPI000440872D|nr:uncharacterized protein FOMMEDRAFT_21422 [Fomitiporia mediterranea MF3/22]EJD00949.1 hypothetical protein FOMMEDRAFT_21422 [Fomitiporia mediterranea MF3/22]